MIIGGGARRDEGGLLVEGLAVERKGVFDDEEGGGARCLVTSAAAFWSARLNESSIEKKSSGRVDSGPCGSQRKESMPISQL